MHYFYERGFDDGFIDSMGFKSTEEALLELNTVAKHVDEFPGALLMHGDLRHSKKKVEKQSHMKKCFLPKRYVNPPKIYLESFGKEGFRTGVDYWTQIDNPYSVDTPELIYYFRSAEALFEPLFYNFFMALPRVYL